MDTNATPKRRGPRPRNPDLAKAAAEVKPVPEPLQHLIEGVFEPAQAPVEAAPTPVEVAQAPAQRQAMRPAMREEDPRARAARRAAELRDHLGEEPDGMDEFYIHPSDIPDGWEYEWKAKYVLGQEQATQMLAFRRAGWEEVPTSRHPSFMPMGTDMPFIERKGMVLMERPKEISDEARAMDLRRARLQVRQKEAQLNSADGGQFERSNKDQSLVNIRKSYESIPIPNE